MPIILVLGVLRRARENLARYGWIQDVFGSKKHGYCAEGAINAASRSEPLKLGAKSELYVTLEAGGDYRILVEWNDYSRRTKEQVLRLFDQTIKRLEAAK